MFERTVETLASMLLISLELLSFFREDNFFYPDSYTRSIYSGWTFMNSQFSSHGSSRTFLSFARFCRTRERLCMNGVRSLLSMRDMLLGYSFPARPSNRASFFPPHSRRQNEALLATWFPGSSPTRSQAISWRVGERTWERGWLCSQDVCQLKIFFCNGHLL